MSITSPPIQTSVDVKIGDAGLSVSVPWSQWFSNMYSTLAGILGALTSTVVSPIPVTLPTEQIQELRNITDAMNSLVAEMRLTNMYLQELPKALNEGYAFMEDVTLRDSSGNLVN